MNNANTRALRVYSRRQLGLLVAMTCIVPSVMASGPSLAGPSVLPVAAGGEFKGSGFTPATTVQIRATDAGGTFSTASMQVTPEGTLSIRVAPATAGVHSIAVLAANGTQLVAISFVAR